MRGGGGGRGGHRQAPARLPPGQPCCPLHTDWAVPSPLQYCSSLTLHVVTRVARLFVALRIWRKHVITGEIALNRLDKCGTCTLDCCTPRFSCAGHDWVWVGDTSLLTFLTLAGIIWIWVVSFTLRLLHPWKRVRCIDLLIGYWGWKRQTQFGRFGEKCFTSPGNRTTISSSSTP